MLVKIHKSYRETIAVCDSDLIEKTFVEGNKELKVTKSFFQGEEKDANQVLELLRRGSEEDCTFNIVGKRSIDLALNVGIIKQEGISYIQGIPFALVLI